MNACFNIHTNAGHKTPSVLEDSAISPPGGGGGEDRSRPGTDSKSNPYQRIGETSCVAFSTSLRPRLRLAHSTATTSMACSMY
jgi:hypothetical protein